MHGGYTEVILVACTVRDYFVMDSYRFFLPEQSLVPLSSINIRIIAL